VLVFLIALELQHTEAAILDKLKDKKKDIKDPTPAPTPEPQKVIVTEKVYVPCPVPQHKPSYGHKPGGYGQPHGGYNQYGNRPYGYGR
jgi:hypothetical protein